MNAAVVNDLECAYCGDWFLSIDQMIEHLQKMHKDRND